MSEIKNENVEVTENEDKDLKYIDLEEPKKEEKVVSKKRKKKDRKAALNRTQFIGIVAGVCIVSVIGGVCAYNNRPQKVELPADFRSATGVLASDIDGDDPVKSEKDKDKIFSPWEDVTPAKQEITSEDFVENTTNTVATNTFVAETNNGVVLDDFDLSAIQNNDSTPEQLKDIYQENIYSAGNTIVFLNNRITTANKYAKQVVSFSFAIGIESENCDYILSDFDLVSDMKTQIMDSMYKRWSGLDPESTDADIDVLVSSLNENNPDLKITKIYLFDCRNIPLSEEEKVGIYSIGDTYWTYDLDKHELVEITKDEYDEKFEETHIEPEGHVHQHSLEVESQTMVE